MVERRRARAGVCAPSNAIVNTSVASHTRRPELSGGRSALGHWITVVSRRAIAGRSGRHCATCRAGTSEGSSTGRAREPVRHPVLRALHTVDARPRSSIPVTAAAAIWPARGKKPADCLCGPSPATPLRTHRPEQSAFPRRGTSAAPRRQSERVFALVARLCDGFIRELDEQGIRALKYRTFVA